MPQAVTFRAFGAKTMSFPTASTASGSVTLPFKAFAITYFLFVQSEGAGLVLFKAVTPTEFLQEAARSKKGLVIKCFLSDVMHNAAYGDMIEQL